MVQRWPVSVPTQISEEQYFTASQYFLPIQPTSLCVIRTMTMARRPF
jgi:hypothetical protein